MHNVITTILGPVARVWQGEEGLSTIEYAMGTIAAAALAGVLYVIVTSTGVNDAIEGIITDALNNAPGR